MKALFSRLILLPPMAILISILATIFLIAPWSDIPTIILDRLHTGLIAIFLAIAIVSAGMKPIHLQHNIKVFLMAAPLYVMAMLLPPTVGGAHGRNQHI